MKAVPAVQPKIQVVLVQSTPFCNIDCRYCYLPDRRVRRAMTVDTLRRLFERVFASGWVDRELRVLWHAGEPMVLGVPYYEQAFEIIESLRPSDVVVTRAMQTNATLVTQAWCDFIKLTGLRIGVSIDGPKDLHDLNRVTRAGRGTFDRTIAGLRLLRANEIDFGVTVVLSRASLDQPEALFDFLVGEGVEKVCLNIEEKVGVHGATSLDDDVYELCRVFMARFWALALESEKFRAVREMRIGFTPIFRPAEAAENPLVQPFAHLNVDVDGNVSTFSPELLSQRNEIYANFRFGNVHTDALAGALADPAFQRLFADVREGVAACARDCDYFDVCGGGSPANKLAENGSVATAETLFCRLTTQLPIDLAREFYEEAAED